MNRLTTIITTIVLGAAIGYNATAAQDETPWIGPPPSTESGQISELGGPPPTLDGGDVPVCLSCD